MGRLENLLRKPPYPVLYLPKINNMNYFHLVL